MKAGHTSHSEQRDIDAAMMLLRRIPYHPLPNIQRAISAQPASAFDLLGVKYKASEMEPGTNICPSQFANLAIPSAQIILESFSM